MNNRGIADTAHLRDGLLLIDHFAPDATPMPINSMLAIALTRHPLLLMFAALGLLTKY